MIQGINNDTSHLSQDFIDYAKNNHKLKLESIDSQLSMTYAIKMVKATMLFWMKVNSVN